MTRRPSDPAVLRGLATGALTAALTLAAHACADGPVTAGAAALLVVFSAGLGILAGSTERVAGLPVLVGLLAAGQLIGHLTLALAEPCHTGSPGVVMLSAHLLAVVAGGLLIVGAERLCRALCTVLQVCAGQPSAGPVAAVSLAPARADHPLQSRLLIAVSISHRGPPAGLR